MKRLYRARILNPRSAKRLGAIDDGGLLVGDDGRIVAVGPYRTVKRQAKEARIVDLAGRVLIPGLVDCHIHLPQLDQRGKHGATLLEWLRRYIFTSEIAFRDLHVAEDLSRRFFKKLILNGTTTAAVYTTVHPQSTALAFELAAASGLRIIMGKVMMDQHCPRPLLETTQRSLRDSEWLCADWHGQCGGRLRYAFTPRFAPTCSWELWEETAKLVEQSGAYLQTHIAETHQENAWVKKLFPKCRDYVDLFEQTECLRPGTLLAHAIHLSRSEYRRIGRADAALAHCPLSNLFLKSGRMPIEHAEAAGVRYGLGTDVGAGPSISMFAVMRHADYVQPEQTITPKHALYLATLGGAKALRMEREVGNFAKGKWADFVVLNVEGVDPVYRLGDLSTDELLSLLMYRGDGRAVEATYVAGERLDVDGF